MDKEQLLEGWNKSYLDTDDVCALCELLFIDIAELKKRIDYLKLMDSEKDRIIDDLIFKNKEQDDAS